MRKALFTALATFTMIATAASAFAAAPLDRGAARPAGPVAIEISVLGSHETGIFDESAAEVVAHDPVNQRLFVVNAAQATIDVLDISDPSNPTSAFVIDATSVGAVANSVAVRDDVIAVAVEASPKTDPGSVAFYSTNDGQFITSIMVGALPDMVTFTPNGRSLLVANEGEPADDYSVDPEGSVSVIDVSGPIADLTQDHVRTATFHAWDDGAKTLHPDVRVFGRTVTPERRISENLEPEYIVADADNRTAYVVLQEANAVAVLDVNAAKFSDIWPFGFKDHLLEGNELDVSDRDGAIRIENWPTFGIYHPDGFDAYRWRGQTLLVTANEGDSRDWDGYSEESRFRAWTAGREVCEDSRLATWLADNDLGISTLAELRENDQMGRLKVTTTAGLAEGGCVAEVYNYGARSFSIWTADGRQVFDSGSDFERITADVNPAFFNSNNDENSFETRSDDKGPEPEGVTIGKVAGRTYAFIGLERIGGVMVYDITDPRAPYYVQYINNRDFSADPGTPESGDQGAEGLVFVEASDSPTGRPMLVVANEVSGTTTLFDISKVTPGQRNR